MPDLMTIVSYGFGTLFGLFLAGFLLYWLVYDLVQEKHSILRNYPLIGHLRYFLERQGEYFRQYLFAGDRDEMPFNRATRTWVYKNAKNEVGVVGFGSTNDLREPGSIIFVNAPFPVLENDLIPTPSFMIGEGYCKQPFNARSVVNISGMSYGALSAPAVRALSRGAAEVGCWMDTGEGGLSPFHLEGDCDIIMQIGTAKYGIRDHDGNFSPERARELSKVVKAFEIKLSQGAKPGKGGILPGIKVTDENAAIRGVPAYQDANSPNLHHDITKI
jgi:glutamate synthase domain-containing protein 2